MSNIFESNIKFQCPILRHPTDSLRFTPPPSPPPPVPYFPPLRSAATRPVPLPLSFPMSSAIHISHSLSISLTLPPSPSFCSFLLPPSSLPILPPSVRFSPPIPPPFPLPSLEVLRRASTSVAGLRQAPPANIRGTIRVWFLLVFQSIVSEFQNCPSPSRLAKVHIPGWHIVASLPNVLSLYEIIVLAQALEAQSITS